MGHDYEVVGPAIAAHEPIGEQGLYLKAEALEHLLNVQLVAGNVYHEALHILLAGDQEDLVYQPPRQAQSAHVACHEDTDLADMPCPGLEVAVERTVTANLTVGVGCENRNGLARLGVFEPFVNDFRLRDVQTQIHHVVGGEALGESQHRVAILGGEQAERNFLSVNPFGPREGAV